jgi:hypothetical protein
VLGAASGVVESAGGVKTNERKRRTWKLEKTNRMAAVYDDARVSQEVVIEVEEVVISGEDGLVGQQEQEGQQEQREGAEHQEGTPDILEEETYSSIRSIPSRNVLNEGSSLGSLLASLSINLLLPFINGLMLGFGEIIAHEIGFHYNWFGANVSVL